MLNKVILIGNLGADPESKRFDNGGMVTNINVATTRRWKNKEKNELQEETEWHRVTFHNRQAEIAAEYLQKGSQVYIEGRIKTRKWQDSNGQDRYSTEIIASQMNMLGKKREGGGAGRAQTAPPQQPPEYSGNNAYQDDVPF